MYECGATAGDDAFLDGRTGGRDGVLDAVLALLELDLGGRAHPDDTDAAGQLGETLLELLLVPVRVGVLDLGLDLAHAGLDLAFLPPPSTIVVSSFVTTTRRACRDLEADLVQLEPDLGGDDLDRQQDTALSSIRGASLLKRAP